MKHYTLTFSNGTEKEFKAKNLREAKKLAPSIKGDYDGWAWIYEGYTALHKLA